MSGDTALPAGHALAVGTPDGVTGSGPTEAQAADATVTLSKPIHNGLTYEFTFSFEKAGKKTLAVPLSAGEAAPREAHH